MTRLRLFCLLATLIVLTAACGGSGQPDDEADSGDERPTVAVTHWTDRTELFMEYPVLVAGERGRSAIHLTDLDDFSPLSRGFAAIGLRSQDGRKLEFRGGPSRPGIFGVDLKVDEPGVYEMTLEVDTGDLHDLHELGPVSVLPAGTVSVAGHDHGGESISFLKEQQWTFEFGTAQADVQSLRSSITVPAIVQPRAGGRAVLAAPVPGRIDASPGAPVPVPGMRVRAGAVLVRIAPRSEDLRDAAGLRAALVGAEQEHLLASRERERSKRLVEARALPSRRLDEAEAALIATRARLDAARERWSRYEALSQSGSSTPGEGSFAVRAPFDGVVSDVQFSPGVSVEENQVLLQLVDADRFHIVGAVPESRVAALESVHAGELLRDGSPPLPLGKPLAVGRVVEPVARTVEVRFAFDNRTARMQVGRSVGLRLFVGDEEARTTIPESALVDDAGRLVVFVQSGGESFERRPVRLGNREAGFVHVLEGVEPGERVVHRGAYLVRLAAMSTQIPSHGHAH